MDYYARAKKFILKNSRPLDMARWNYLFENGSKEEVINILKNYQNDDGGFAEMVFGYLTSWLGPVLEINDLTEHLKTHIHDYHSKRGLLMKVGKRRSLLDYLKKNDVVSYRETIKKLNIRK